jgi:hypothetical protein
LAVIVEENERGRQLNKELWKNTGRINDVLGGLADAELLENNSGATVNQHHALSPLINMDGKFKRIFKRGITGEQQAESPKCLAANVVDTPPGSYDGDEPVPCIQNHDLIRIFIKLRIMLFWLVLGSQIRREFKNKSG